MTAQLNARDVVHTWNPSPTRGWQAVEIEDDTFRDGLQGAFVRRPSLEEACELLRSTAEIGTQNAMLGFPAAGAAELDRCRALLRVIEAERLPMTPRFLARALVADIDPILALQDDLSTRVEADCFIGTSPIRRHVEGWN